jgi:hypothetical protein
MAIRDLVTWNSRGREVGGPHDEEPYPILSLPFRRSMPKGLRDT